MEQAEEEVAQEDTSNDSSSEIYVENFDDEIQEELNLAADVDKKINRRSRGFI
jgi:hypothetical protein